ncbi:hypothetical protein [Alteromonas sp. 14N.309.X.WAT.G.H12]|uniref:hypothetical protein n=1 Tax=Alteromonas sp. 14N.309.X.WAT.G.H12 TaxID=3120824 RepID=UPI002FD0E9BE
MRLRDALTIIYRRCLSRPRCTVIVFTLLAVCVFSPLSYQANHCQSVAEREYNESAAQFCLVDGNMEVSWLKWLSGKSPSIQFHLFDLLELLYDNSNGEYTPTKGR